MSDTTITQVGHFIGGRLVPPGGGRSLDKISPHDGRATGSVSLADEGVVDRAVEAARKVQPVWEATALKARCQVFFRFKQLVESNLDRLTRTISEENGKTEPESRAEVERGMEVVEFAVSIPNLGLESRLEVSAGVDCHTKLFPLGIVAGITPFNFPAMVPMWMFPVAVVCGNAFILKPSEQVPRSALVLAELMAEAGLPASLFSVVNGDKVTVDAILKHEGISAIGFVGSSPVAKHVYETGTLAGKRVLALGGAKNHLVVVPDADPEITAENIVASVTGCAGQRCMAASVLIAVGDCDSILDSIVERAGMIKPGVNMGPVISQKALDRIASYIDQAEEAGAEIRLDGRQPRVEGAGNGFYVAPTIIDRLRPDSPCAQDEIFGPVLSILRVDTLDEAIALENANPFGNAASIYTSSGATARHFSERASAGMIGVNIGVPVPRDPFAFGGWNDSRFGTGDMTGESGVRFWTKTKKITQKWTASASQDWMS